MNDVKKGIFTIPNILSFFRIALIPVYAIWYLKAVVLRDYVISASLLALSCLTDMADGIIARKCNMVSDLGIMLDPLADKLTQGVIILCLSIRKPALLPLLILFLIKEGAMLFMGWRIVKKKQMLDGALPEGKICTTVTFLGMIALVVFPRMPVPVTCGIVIVCAGFMIYSLVSYVRCYHKKEHIKDMNI